MTLNVWSCPELLTGIPLNFMHTFQLLTATQQLLEISCLMLLLVLGSLGLLGRPTKSCFNFEIWYRIIFDIMMEIWKYKSVIAHNSPACTELEMVMMDWLGKMLNLPQEFLFRLAKYIKFLRCNRIWGISRFQFKTRDEILRSLKYPEQYYLVALINIK